MVLLIFKRSMANYCALSALFLGLTRTYGHPQINPQYLSRIMYDERFHSILYLGIVFMIGSVNFVLYVPLLLHALLESGAVLATYLQTF